MSAPPNVFVGKLDLDGNGPGVSEVYWLKGGTVAAAKTSLTNIVNARKAMLSDEIEIVYAYVSQLGVKRDSYFVPAALVSGSDTVTANRPNRFEDCIRVRQESQTGRICNRYLHGAPDPAIVDKAYVRGAVAAFDTALDAYLVVLAANSGFLLIDRTTTPPTYNVQDWGLVVQMGYSHHKAGKPFGLRPGRRSPA